MLIYYQKISYCYVHSNHFDPIILSHYFFPPWIINEALCKSQYSQIFYEIAFDFNYTIAELHSSLWLGSLNHQGAMGQKEEIRTYVTNSFIALCSKFLSTYSVSHISIHPLIFLEIRVIIKILKNPCYPINDN